MPTQKEKKAHKENIKLAAKQSMRSLYSEAGHPGLPHYSQLLSKIRLEPPTFPIIKENYYKEDLDPKPQFSQRNYDTFSPERVYSKEYLQASPSFHQTTESDRDLTKDVESVQTQSSEQIEQL